MTALAATILLLAMRSTAPDVGSPPAPAPATTPAASPTPAPADAPAGMVWIPAGTFTMGSTDPLARPDESPRHRVTLRGFWIDATEVTNAQFRAFADATGYKTVAERPVDWEGQPVFWRRVLDGG